eukprot:5168-Heterococcus_DN1.PRE.10
MLGVLTYSTEREVLSWHIELREAVEERGLAHVGHTYYAKFDVIARPSKQHLTHLLFLRAVVAANNIQVQQSNCSYESAVDICCLLTSLSSHSSASGCISSKIAAAIHENTFSR